MEYKHISSIRGLRKEYKLTQDEFSYILGMSTRNYREKECGKVCFTQYEIMKMIYFFEIESDDAFRIFYLKGYNSIFWRNSSNKIKTMEDNIKKIKLARKDS